MKKFNIIKVFLLFIFLLPFSCIDNQKPFTGNNKQDSIQVVIENNDSLVTDTLQEGMIYGVSMYNVYEKEFTKEQFDSICKADLLINDLQKWHQLVMKDGETNEVVIEYMFIKSLGSYECIYRLIKVNQNTYKITKRIKRN